MEEERFSLVQELTNEYYVEKISKSEVEIHIRIPKKFEDLWLSKLSELTTSTEEINEHTVE